MANKYPLLRAVHLAIEEKGVWLLIMLRMCPVVPFTPVNFFFGATRMSFGAYTIGLLGILPTTLGHVFLGTTLSDIEDAIKGKTNWKDNFWLLIMVILGTALAIIAIIWLSVVTNRYLNQIIREKLD